MPAPGAQAAILPWALSACDNAAIEEARAREREVAKQMEKERFAGDTRMFLLQRMQEIEAQKEREREAQADKIKKLLADTIECSQRTAMMKQY